MKTTIEKSSLAHHTINHTVPSTWLPYLEDRISKSQASSFANTLHHDEDNISTLFKIMSDNPDSKISYHAALIFSHLSTEDKEIYLSPRTSELIRLALSAQNTQNQRAYFSILADMPHIDENNMMLLDFCLSHIPDARMSLACRSYMIKIAANLCKPYPELMNELAICLELLPAGLSPSLSSAKRNALRYIRKVLRQPQ